MKKWTTFRLGLVFTSFLCVFSLVIFRLVQLQVLPNQTLDALAKKQFNRVTKDLPYRLPIFDRNHEEMAISTPGVSIYARPKLIKARKKTATILAKYFGGTQQTWLKKLNPKKGFVWIQRQVTDTTAEKISSLRLAGIFTEPANRRIYPNGELAADVLGFTGVDGQGLSGMELALNPKLLQESSNQYISRDGRGNPSYIETTKSDTPQKEILLTIDRRIQYILEEEIQQAAEETKARSVMAVIMDPFSGEILAMGQRPSFDPNQARSASSNIQPNGIISSLYEPGSTLKALLAAEAIEQKVMNRNTPIDCGKGKMTIGNVTIREAEADHQYGVISLEKVIRYSSNIGAIRVAQALGPKRLSRTLDRFGLTRKTDIGLPGETSGQPRSEEFWKSVNVASAGFGQGVSSTPLQITASFAPLANGGFRVQPTLLLNGAHNRPSEKDRILSPETVAAMRDILVSVTEDKKGTGTNAKIEGLKVAGKTGTAQKYDASHGYQAKKYFASFIGFLPADHPQLLIGVMLDEPKFPYYASQVAAPLFRKIAERSFRILNRTPQPVLAATANTDTTSGTTEKTRLVPMEKNAEGQWIMPDLHGLSMAEAIKLIGKHPGVLKMDGTGYLQLQDPAPKTVLNPETEISLTFQPSS